MDDDSTKKGPADAQSDDPDSDSSSASRMYDFSDDLNISPVTDEAAANEEAAQAAPAKPPVNRLDEQAPAPVAPEPAVPKGSADKPAVPAVPKDAPAPAVTSTKPATTSDLKTSYREPIETAKEWPFALNQNAPSQPRMGQMSPKPMPTVPKTQPGNSPVKTIQSESETDVPEDKDRPATSLQRDVSTILPNLRKDGPQGGAVPLQSGTPLTQIQNGDIKSLRTYEGDVAEVLSHRHTSATSIALAESKKLTGVERIASLPEKPAREKASSSFAGKLFFVLLSLALVGAGGIGGYYMYTHSMLFVTQQPVPIIPQSSQSLVPADSQGLAGINKLDQATILARISAEIAKPQDPETVREIVPINMTAAQPTRMTPKDMANALKLPIPDILLRTLNPSWMFGVFAGTDGAKHPFVVLTTDFFQNALSGMLGWEASMPRDLALYIQTSSSTSLAGQFKDQIVQNKDVRAYVTVDGQTLFVYSFVDNSTLVVAQDDGTLGEIVTRLENRVFSR